MNLDDESSKQRLVILVAWVIILLLLGLSTRGAASIITSEDSQDDPGQPYLVQANSIPEPLPKRSYAAFLDASREYNRDLGYRMALNYGYSEHQWECFDELVFRESGWNHLIWNRAGSGAYGIPQSLPASKMATHGEDYMTNPETQIAWMLDYISNRYGDACTAIGFHDKNNWY